MMETSKMSDQNEWLQERNSLQEEALKWKTLLQQRTQEARDRIQEMKNELLQQQEEERAAFRVWKGTGGGRREEGGNGGKGGKGGKKGGKKGRREGREREGEKRGNGTGRKRRVRGGRDGYEEGGRDG
jgi:hypothetical protein